jgi:hypothetical protein
VRSIPTGRLYYSISEVSDMIGVKPHVLRYWETQFKMLRPRKGRGGARMYRKRDVEVLFEVKQLLYDHRFCDRRGGKEAPDDRGSKEQMELPFARTDPRDASRSRRVLEDFSTLHGAPTARGLARGSEARNPARGEACSD